MYLHLSVSFRAYRQFRPQIFPTTRQLCRKQKHIVFILSLCFWPMHSIPSTFRSGFSFVPHFETYTPFSLSLHTFTTATHSRGYTLSISQVPFHEYSHCSFPSLSSSMFLFPASYSPRNIILVWLIQLSEKKYHLYERKKEEEKESGSAM